MQKKKSGDAFKGFPYRLYNDLLEMRRLWKVGKLLIGRRAARDLPDADLVKVKNTTGATIARFGVLGISGVIITPTDRANQFKQRPALTGTTPTTADHAGKFVIVQEPIRAGKTGLAIVSGVSVAKLNVGDADHQFADVRNADATELDTGNTGAARILYKESGTGSGKWGLVRVSNGSPGGSVWMVKAQVDEVGGVAADDATFNVDNVSIVQPDANADYPNGATPTQFNNSLDGELDDDAYIYAVYNVTTELWDTIAGPCPA